MESKGQATGEQQSASAKRDKDARHGCLLMLLVLGLVYGPLLLPGLLAPETIALGWGLAWRATLGALGVSFVVVVGIVVAAFVASKRSEGAASEKARAASVQPASRRVAEIVSVVSMLGGVLALLLWPLAHGVAYAVNASALGEPRGASCVLPSCGRRRCEVSCTVDGGGLIHDPSVVRVDALPQPQQRFRARLQQGRLGVWLLREGSIEVFLVALARGVG